MTSECWDEPAEIPPQTLWDVLSSVPDHRHASGRRYPLPALLTMALAAMLCGRTSQAGIVRWSQGLARADLKALGIRERRTPCPSTWCLLFQRLNVAVLEPQLAAWVQGDRTRLGHVAVDGKRLRGSRDGESRGVHLLAAFSNELKGVIGTIAVPSETTEAKAMLTVLKPLPLTGLVITAEAAFTQRDIARDIVEGGGQYFLVVKDNQAMLRREIEGAVGPASPHSSLSGALSPDAGQG